MRRAFPAVLAVCMSLLSPFAVWAQTGNACDLNQDGVVDVRDIQLAINMVRGLAPCSANIVAAGVCNIIVVQRVTNAVLTGTCSTGATIFHSVSLSWTASTSPNVTGYNVYRGAASSGPFTKLTSNLVAALNYTDTAVQAGQTYYYVTTAVDNSNNESAYSTPAQAVIPSP